MPCRSMFSVVILFCLSASPALARTWTSASGTFKVEAELIEARSDGTLLLKRPNGQRVQVKLDQLSQADRDFVRQKAVPPKSDSPSPPAKQSLILIDTHIPEPR